ncbi:hypothetical protein ACIG5E_33290, partial [Kitasatospora sp. NPDC053057]|uniref:hypothetical protein n=1 Tax=Kitasatospora sp. NPDC053057 TaxID=3364062 RepID=UPI0037CC1392
MTGMPGRICQDGHADGNIYSTGGAVRNFRRRDAFSACRLTSAVTRPAEISGIRQHVTRPFFTLR